MAIDITKQKEIEENAQLQTAELKQQEEMIRQNMEELSRKQIELEEKLIKYQTFENLLNSNTETSLTKKIGNWLDSI